MFLNKRHHSKSVSHEHTAMQNTIPPHDRTVSKRENQTFETRNTKLKMKHSFKLWWSQLGLILNYLAPHFSDVYGLDLFWGLCCLQGFPMVKPRERERNYCCLPSASKGQPEPAGVGHAESFGRGDFSTAFGQPSPEWPYEG